MSGETTDWLDSYYEALEFFYWEPQHFRAKTNAAAEVKKLDEIAKKSTRFGQVTSHLRQMEVTLNHNINQFFLLPPDAFRNSLFEKLFVSSQFKKAFEMQGREIDEKFALGSCMQPDLLFISEGEVVSIEMKIKSQCSIDQVLKYVLLGRGIEITQKVQKEHYLVLLGPGAIENQFTQRFKSSDEITDALKKEDLTKFLSKKPPIFRQDQEHLQRIVKNMKVRFLNYEELTNILTDAVPQQSDQSAGAEVYRNLINGLCHEISRRRLS